MDNQNSQAHPVNPPQSESVAQPTPAPVPIHNDLAPVPQITLSAEDRADIKVSKFFKRMAVVGAIVVTILAIAISSFVISAKNNTNTQSKSQASKNGASSSSQSPLTSGNSSVNSDVKYCSNLVNANLYC